MVPGTSAVKVTECEFSNVEFGAERDPYAGVAPYATCALEAWSVVQEMVADLAARLLKVTALITGTAPPPVLAARSSSAGAAQGEVAEAAEQLTKPAAGAVLSHRAIST